MNANNPRVLFRLQIGHLLRMSVMFWSKKDRAS